MISAVLAPVRSRMVFIATVDPWRNKPASAYAVPAFPTPAVMPSTRRCGVDSALPSLSLPVAASNAATSVKVPPMSAARRKSGRPAGNRDWFDCMGKAQPDCQQAQQLLRRVAPTTNGAKRASLRGAGTWLGIRAQDGRSESLKDCARPKCPAWADLTEILGSTKG